MTRFINLLTITRILLAPIILFFLIFGEYLLCVFLFLLAGMSDYFDGYFARKYNAESQLGEILDPIADKILVVFILIFSPGAGKTSVPVSNISTINLN